MVRGAFLFPDDWMAWDHETAVSRLTELKRWGITAVCTESEHYRDDLIELAHGLDLKWYGGIACFSDHANGNALLQARPELWPITADGQRRELMEWYIGVTPTFADYREERLALAERLVRQHALDGFVLDFIRWPLHWELECRPGATPQEGSFDPHSLTLFAAQTGIRLPAEPAAAAAQILSQHRQAWTDFKCGVVTDFVARASARVKAARPHCHFGLYLLPLPEADRQALAGQRVTDLAPLVDFVAPMAYHAILHRDAAWVQEIVAEAARTGPVLPVVQVDSAEGAAAGADWGPPVPVAEWVEIAAAALQAAGGLIAFTGTALKADGRGELLSRLI